MSREIKFRIWSKKESQFFNQTINYTDGKWFSFGSVYLLDEAGLVLQQFTGLTDKNGKGIYEGDLVKFIPIIDKKYRDEFIGEIFYDEDEAAFFHTFEEGRPSKRFFNLPKEWILEIIGNIFEGVKSC